MYVDMYCIVCSKVVMWLLRGFGYGVSLITTLCTVLYVEYVEYPPPVSEKPFSKFLPLLLKKKKKKKGKKEDTIPGNLSTILTSYDTF